MEALLGKNLKTATNTDIETSSLEQVSVVCLYFSGSFCGPCKKFNLYLGAFYEEINCDDYNLEVVLVPADDKEKSFVEYLSKMPWKSLPFADPRIKGRVFAEWE